MTDDTVITETTLCDLTADALRVGIIPTVNAKLGNTGNGQVQDARAAAPVALGIYTATLTDPTHYQVKDAAGTVLGNVVVGQLFGIEGLRFAVMPGTVAFIAGDAFAITVVPATSAADRVYAPRDWPTKPELFPIIHVMWSDEDKESWGPNAPGYDVTADVVVVAKVASLAEKGDAGADACRAALGMIKRQVEVAVINNYALYRIISEIGSVRTKAEVRNEGQLHIGEITMTFAMKFSQYGVAFAPVLADPISQIAIFADLLDVADPSGTYTPPFDYEVTPAPRTIGPDGRVEAGAIVELEP